MNLIATSDELEISYISGRVKVIDLIKINNGRLDMSKYILHQI